MSNLFRAQTSTFDDHDADTLLLLQHQQQTDA